MDNKPLRIKDFNSPENTINPEKDITNNIISDTNENLYNILDLNIAIKKLINDLNKLESIGGYENGYNLIDNFIINYNYIKDSHKGYLYEKIGDYSLNLGNYNDSLKFYNIAKKFGNQNVYEKIINLYTSGILLKESDDLFTWENNIDSLLGECSNACEYNNDAYGDLGYYTYLYKSDIKGAKKILEKGIELGSNNAIIKYIEIIKTDFFNKLSKIKDDKKKDFILSNKQKIEEFLYKQINLGNKEYLGELGDFYEKIGFYYKAVELYKQHLGYNSNYLYYKTLADILNSGKCPLYNTDETNLDIINYYTKLYELSTLKNDYENQIYGLKELFRIHITNNDIDNYTKIGDLLIRLANNNGDIYVLENVLLDLFKANDSFYSKQIISNNKEIDLSRNDMDYQKRIIIDYNNEKKSYFEIQRNILDKLIKIDNTHLVLEGLFYEKIDKNKSLNSYFTAFNEGVYDSGILLGIFLDGLLLEVNNPEHIKLIKDIRDLAYKNDTILHNEIQIIKEIIK